MNQKVREELVGAMIALARTTYNHGTTENTEKVLLEALFTLGGEAGEREATLKVQLEKVRREQRTIAPGCATCEAKCGLTDEYDLQNMYNAPADIRAAKEDLLALLVEIGKHRYMEYYRKGARSALAELLYKGLFVIAEDWEPGEISAVAKEIRETEKMI